MTDNYKHLIDCYCPRIIKNEKDLDLANTVISGLLDNLHTRKLTVEEEDYMHLIGLLVHEYESIHYPIPDADPIDVIKSLLEENNLKQKDLVPCVFATESIASAVLSSKRELTLGQIKALSKRFNISPNVFIKID